VDRKFDIVILWHVLEHIAFPEEALDEIIKHLNPGALLVIAVPNFSSLQRKIFGKNWFHLDLPRHLVHIDEQWIKKQMVKQRLTVVHESHTDLIQNTYGFIQSLLNVCNPSRPNQFYRLLKQGFGPQRYIRFPFLTNLLLSLIFLPFAFVEGAISTAFRKGATIQVVAKLDKAND
jgi:SAM-dependent methyltransferase